jgi:hypothetical protein
MVETTICQTCGSTVFARNPHDLSETRPTPLNWPAIRVAVERAYDVLLGVGERALVADLVAIRRALTCLEQALAQIPSVPGGGDA